MGRWITDLFATRGAAATNLDEGCPICDHPFGHLTHACISSAIGPVASFAARQVLLPEAVVA